MTGLLPVSEVFGPVWQGEGPHAGQLCHFLRTGLCNLHCTWCDTPYTWDGTRFDVDTECPPRDATWILDRLPHRGLIVLSGGEPLIHQRNATLATVMQGSKCRWHVETNGTLAPSPEFAARVELFMVSPKVTEQGDPEGRRLRPAALTAFADLAREGRAAWKIVCALPGDVERAVELFDRYGVPAEVRWVMPEGRNTVEVVDSARRMAQATLENGLNLTLRQHVFMYGTKRGH